MSFNALIFIRKSFFHPSLSFLSKTPKIRLKFSLDRPRNSVKFSYKLYIKLLCNKQYCNIFSWEIRTVFCPACQRLSSDIVKITMLTVWDFVCLFVGVQPTIPYIQCRPLSTWKITPRKTDYFFIRIILYEWKNMNLRTSERCVERRKWPKMKK